MKLPITLEIEKALIRRFYGTATRYATEVTVSYESGGKIKSGIVDFVTSKHDFQIGQPVIGCYEIKVSFSDMKSEHGHTLVGDENYYVMPPELFKEILEKDANLVFGDFGILVYESGKLKIARKSCDLHLRSRLSIERRFRVLDDILMRQQNGHVRNEPEKKENE